MRELIHAGARLDAKNIDGYAPIHTSANKGDLPTLHELVEAGSSPAWRTFENETSLSLACVGGHLDCVEYLVDKCKVDPGARGYLEKTPLANASSKGHLEIVKVLLRCGVHRLGSNAFQEALFAVAMHGHIEVLRELINAEGGVHVNRANTAYSMRALHITAGFCHPIATSMLLEAGADEFAEDRNGQTPFVVIDTLRHDEVQHGVGGARRIRRMLMQAPAYRARSWKWPVASTSPPAPNAGEFTAGDAEEAGPAKGREQPVDMTDEDLDRAFDVALAVTSAHARMGKVRVTVFRRPATGSSGSAADGHSAVVANLIRYNIFDDCHVFFVEASALRVSAAVVRVKVAIRAPREGARPLLTCFHPQSTGRHARAVASRSSWNVTGDKAPAPER